MPSRKLTLEAVNARLKASLTEVSLQQRGIRGNQSRQFGRQIEDIKKLLSAIGERVRKLEHHLRNKQQLSTKTDRFYIPLEASIKLVSQSKRSHCQKLWAFYRAGIQTKKLQALDRQVTRKALEHKQSLKDISLMLAAGSPHVRRIYQRRGKQQAMNYAKQTVGALRKEQVLRRKHRLSHNQLEI